MEIDARIARALADGIIKVRELANSEEDLRIGIEKLLGPTLEALGITHRPEYEKTILQSGSADAVYGHVTIEYERPGKLVSRRGMQETSTQLVRYLVGAASKHGKRENVLRRMIGVSLDGQSILFVRYRWSKLGTGLPLPTQPGQLTLFKEEGVRGEFQILGPYPVTEESVGLFLAYLRALARRPLTAEGLTEVFGPKGDVATQVIDTLHSRLAKKANARVKTFFAEWERIFGAVYGEELERAEKDLRDLAEWYHLSEDVNLKPLLFSVHTYYALLMKLIAVEVASLQSGSLVSSFIADLPALQEKELRQRLTDLEEGGAFQRLGIKNFLEGDFFRWYLAIWDDEVASAVREIARRLSEFEPATATLEPGVARDLLKKVYQYLMPKKLRHDLGEYYTPDWLAERLLIQVGYDGDPHKRLLDPACGSGTFLVLAIARAKDYALRKMLAPQDVARKILQNIVGFDLNPLAVVAARTNYLLAFGDLLRFVRPIELPIYLCDSVLTPSEHVVKIGKLFPEQRQGYVIPTTVGKFEIPRELTNKENMEILSSTLEECIQGGYSVNEFLKRIEARLDGADLEQARPRLKHLFEQLLRLEQEGRNRIWARILKNAFAPVFVGKFDYVVGNPPWVNWESLAEEYRKASAPLWVKFGLMAGAKGDQFELGKVKRDLSMLFVYVCSEEYLKVGGRLGFVITQTLFKTESGEVFRRFRLPSKNDLRLIQVDDMVELQPFEGASNWTSVMVCEKGPATKYPIPYVLWHKVPGKAIRPEQSLEEVSRSTRTVQFHAKPIYSEEGTSPWLTARRVALDALSKAIGKAEYQARAGVVTWLDGVYWVDIVGSRPDKLLVIENQNEAGKRKVPRVQAAIEPGLLHPLIKWGDISAWSASPSAYIIVPHTRETGWRAIPEEEMKQSFPATFAYLKQFEGLLKGRSGYRQLRQGEPFYIISNTNPDVFTRVKVLWRTMGDSIKAAVVTDTWDKYLGRQIPLFKNTITYVPLQGEEEAHYVCAVLNSSVSNCLARSYGVRGGKSFGSVNLLDYLQIPRFDSSNPLHYQLAALSKQAHETIAKTRKDGKAADLADLVESVDRFVAKMWGITSGELAEIRRTLRDLGTIKVEVAEAAT